ncbi:MAG TPA: hypothetical protein VF719_02090 [Abditibacteriaceae bacterium]|jgi:hypothetical protein
MSRINEWIALSTVSVLLDVSLRQDAARMVSHITWITLAIAAADVLWWMRGVAHYLFTEEASR